MGKKKTGKKLRKKEAWGESPATPVAVGEVVDVTPPMTSLEDGSGDVGQDGVNDVDIKAAEGLEIVACESTGEGDAGKPIQDEGGSDGGGETPSATTASKNVLRNIQKKWKNSSKLVERGKTVATLAKNCPSIRILEQGFDLLNNIPDRFGRYSSPCPWDARQFANKMSSGFSSFPITDNLDGPCVGQASFVSDWENLKELITSPFTDDSRSFLLHKVGKSIFVDRFDLKNVVGPPVFSEWPWLRQFALSICENQESKLIREGKSESEIMTKANYLKLLYFGVNEMLECENAPPKPKITEDTNDFTQELNLLSQESTLRGSKKTFLHKGVMKVGGSTLLAGTDVPIFQEKLTKDGVKTSLRLVDKDATEGLDSVTAMDIWLDNVLLNIPKACIVSHADGKVVSTNVIDTDDLPSLGSFDPEPLIHEASFILKRIVNGVAECGHTYWMFKAQGSTEFKIFDLTALSAAEEIEKQKDDATQNPYQLAFGIHLYRTAIIHHKMWKIATFESMLRHASCLLKNTQPLISVALKVLNTFTVSNTSQDTNICQPNLHYDWSEEMDYVYNDGLSVNLVDMCVLIFCLEKLDMGDGKVYDELSKPNDAAVILSKYDMGGKVVVADKNLSILAHFLWSKRHSFPRKSTNSTFKVDRMATHESFETAIESQKSTDAKKLKKLESQLRREKYKNLNQRCLESSCPSMSEKQHRLLKTIVNMRCAPAKENDLNVRQWITVVKTVRKITELVSAWRDYLNVESQCSPELTGALRSKIRRTLTDNCHQLAEMNVEINLASIPPFLYEVLYGTPLMNRDENGVPELVADILLYCAKELTFDAIRSWETHRQDPSTSTYSSYFVGERDRRDRLANSRVFMNLESIIEDCKLKVQEALGVNADERNEYPTIPQYNGDLLEFYKDMVGHFDDLEYFMPNRKVDIVNAKMHLGHDIGTADVRIQMNGGDNLEFWRNHVLYFINSKYSKDNPTLEEMIT